MIKIILNKTTALPLLVIAIIGFGIAIFTHNLCVKVLLGGALLFFILSLVFKIFIISPVHLWEVKFHVEVWGFKWEIPFPLILIILFIIFQRIGLCT